MYRGATIARMEGWRVGLYTDKTLSLRSVRHRQKNFARHQMVGRLRGMSRSSHGDGFGQHQKLHVVESGLQQHGHVVVLLVLILLGLHALVHFRGVRSKEGRQIFLDSVFRGAIIRLVYPPRQLGI